LCDEKSQIKVIQAEGGIVELVDICEEANVFGGFICERVASF
jgi:hypothetical protein